MNYTRHTLTCRSEDQITQGFIERRDLGVGERAGRGLRTAGLLGLAAVFSVFVPILHFILVPGFLLASLIFGFAGWYSKAEINQGEYTCPNCKRLHKLGKMSESFPYVVRCQGCSFTLTLDRG